MANGNGRGKLVAVIGGQFGSEGKGVIVNHLANQFQVHVRVGGPNAGHSFYRKSDLVRTEVSGPPTWNHSYTKEIMQQLPCGWTNRDATLIIGPGAVVDMKQLVKEIDHVEETFDPDIRRRVLISAQAFPLTDEHHAEEGGTSGDLHRKIGSTGHGVGAARHDRMGRDPGMFGPFPLGQVTDEQLIRWNLKRDQIYARIPEWLNDHLTLGKNVLLEGTQGSGLSLIHGPWPYVTSTDTNVAQLLADSGLSPFLLDRCIMVCRTYPIRVAGNSGPMWSEISWDELNRRMGREGITEQTTVTKKTRRIGEWDEDLVLRACVLNHPTDIALTFLDYISPEDEGKEDFDKLSDNSKKFIEYVETLCEVPVTLLGTGGPHWSVIERNFAI